MIHYRGESANITFAPGVELIDNGTRPAETVPPTPIYKVMNLKTITGSTNDNYDEAQVHFSEPLIKHNEGPKYQRPPNRKERRALAAQRRRK